MIFDSNNPAFAISGVLIAMLAACAEKPAGDATAAANAAIADSAIAQTVPVESPEILVGKQDFAYSDALRNSAIVWTEESLDRYIEDPASIIPGGAMAFVGVKDDAERKAVLTYLIAKTGDGDSDLSVPSDQGEDVAIWK